jgi:hypothetical protein
MSHSKMVLNAFDSSPLSVMNHLALSKVLELALYIIHRQCDDIGKQEKKRARRTNLCTTRSCLSYDVLCSQLTTVPGTVLLLSVTRTDSGMSRSKLKGNIRTYYTGWYCLSYDTALPAPRTPTK